MMEADSVHSTLEKIFKPPIYSPSDYIARMRLARPKQPYNIKVLNFDFFLNYDKIYTLHSLRPGNKVGDRVVTDICRILYCTNGNILFKTDFTDNCGNSNDWESLNEILNCNRASRSNSNSSQLNNILLPLYNSPLPITAKTKGKYDDLQSLKPIIEKDHYPFYNNLLHTNDQKKKRQFSLTNRYYFKCL